MWWRVVVVHSFLHNDNGDGQVFWTVSSGSHINAPVNKTATVFEAAAGAVLDAGVLQAQDRALRFAEAEEHGTVNEIAGILHHVAGLFGDILSRSSFLEAVSDSSVDTSVDRMNESAALLSVHTLTSGGTIGVTPLRGIRDQPHTMVDALPRAEPSGRSKMPYLVGLPLGILGGYLVFVAVSELFASQGIPKSSTLLNGGFGQGLDKSWAEVLVHASILQRSVLTLFVVTVLVLDIVLDDAKHSFILYISRWALLVQALYLLVGAISTYYFGSVKLGPADLHAKAWVLRLNSSMMATSHTVTMLSCAIYWATDFPQIKLPYGTYMKNWPMVIVCHVTMFLATMADLIIVRQPYYVADMVYPISVAVAHGLFGFVYFKVCGGKDEDGNQYAYYILPWRTQMLKSLGVDIVICFVFTPIIHLFFYVFAKSLQPVTTYTIPFPEQKGSDRESSLSELEDAPAGKESPRADPYWVSTGSGTGFSTLGPNPTLGVLARPSVSNEIDDSLEEFSRKSQALSRERKGRGDGN